MIDFQAEIRQQSILLGENLRKTCIV